MRPKDLGPPVKRVRKEAPAQLWSTGLGLARWLIVGQRLASGLAATLCFHFALAATLCLNAEQPAGNRLVEFKQVRPKLVATLCFNSRSLYAKSDSPYENWGLIPYSFRGNSEQAKRFETGMGLIRGLT